MVENKDNINQRNWIQITLRLIGLISIIAVFSAFIVVSIVVSRVRPEVDEFKKELDNQVIGLQNENFKYFNDTEVYDINNNLIGKVSTNSYDYVKLEDAGTNIIKGYVAVEDKNFYFHNGVDYRGILKAALSLVKNRGKITMGGSTITQQTLKNNVIGRDENKYVRKVKEILMAGKFEESLGKDKVMEIYINTNPYGNQCFGVQAASQYYFGKPVKDLDMHQIAFLVGISNAPTAYNPKLNPEKSKQKTNIVLGTFKKEGLITEEEYNKMIKEDLKFVYKRDESSLTNPIMVLSLKEAADRLIENEGFNIKEAEKTKSGKEDYQKLNESYVNLLKTGGYKIYTSIDMANQNKFQELFSNSFKGYTKKDENGKFALQGAAVLVNNKTGLVETVIGSRDPQDQFNRGILSYRQPGSSIKPLAVYAPAVEGGEYFPSRHVVDKPITIKSGDTIFKPRNAYRGFRGEMPLREALARSVNTIAYQLMEEVTPQKSSEYLDKLGWDKITDDDRSNLSLALGGMKYGVTPMELAKGFSTLANDGVYLDTGIIMKINYQFSDTNKISKVAEIAIKNDLNTINEILKKNNIKNNNKKSEKEVKKDNQDNIFNINLSKKSINNNENALNIIQIDPETGKLNKETLEKVSVSVFNPATSYITLSMMEDSVNKPYGTSKRAYTRKNVQIAGKTGTTNDQKDAWFVGMTPDYTLCIWVGYDQPKSLGFYGSDKPVQIWNTLMSSMSNKLTTKEFKMPESVGYRNITSSGYPTSKDTGQKDLFNIELLDKQKELEKKLAEEARIKEQQEFEDGMPSRVDNYINDLESAMSGDYSPDKLKKDHDTIISDINKIKNTRLQNELESKVVEVWSKYEDEIITKQEKIKEDEKLKKEKKYANEIFSLENKVNKGSLTRTEAETQYNKLYNKVASVENKELRDDYIYKMELLKDLINMIPDPTDSSFNNLEYNVTNDSGDNTNSGEENFSSSDNDSNE